MADDFTPLVEKDDFTPVKQFGASDDWSTGFQRFTRALSEANPLAMRQAPSGAELEVLQAHPLAAFNLINLVRGMVQPFGELLGGQVPEGVGHLVGALTTPGMPRALPTPPGQMLPEYNLSTSRTTPGTIATASAPSGILGKIQDYALKKAAGMAGVPGPIYDILRSTLKGSGEAAIPEGTSTVQSGLPPPPKYTVSSTATRTPYLANVPKPKAASEPTPLVSPPSVGSIEVPEGAPTRYGEVGAQYGTRIAKAAFEKDGKIASYLKSKGVTADKFRKATDAERNGWAKEADPKYRGINPDRIEDVAKLLE